MYKQFENEHDIEMSEQHSQNSQHKQNKLQKRLKTYKQDLQDGQDYFQPSRIPPNWERAENHRHAQMAGKETLSQPGCQICVCCAKQSNKELFHFSDRTQKLAVLGIGYPLYFQFIKSLVLLLATVFFVFSQYNLFTNILGSDCIDETQLMKNLDALSKKGLTPNELTAAKGNMITNTCVLNFITKLSYANKRFATTEVLYGNILDITACITIIGIIFFIRKIQSEMIQVCDREQLFFRNLFFFLIK